MPPKKSAEQPTAASAESLERARPPLKNPEILLQLLPIVFHKLKNKLTPILGYAQILKTRCTDEFSSSRLQKIEDSSLNFTDLLNKLKDYFQAPNKAKQPASINTIVSGLAERAREMAPGIDIKLNLDPAVAEHDMHPEEIATLLLELVDNAVQSLECKDTQPKAIIISTQAGQGATTLKLRDNGQGIAGENLDKIWSPFYSTWKKSGLGLALCEKIIANHQASCSVDSRLGEYCEFSISFPGT